MELSNSK